MDNKDLCRSAVDWKVNTAPQHVVAVSHWQLLVYWLAESVSEASKQLPFSYLQIFSETNASATWMARAAHHLEPSQTWVTTEASELFETITFTLILLENPLATLNWIRGHPAWRRRRIVCLSLGYAGILQHDFNNTLPLHVDIQVVSHGSCRGRVKELWTGTTQSPWADSRQWDCEGLDSGCRWNGDTPGRRRKCHRWWLCYQPSRMKRDLLK